MIGLLAGLRPAQNAPVITLRRKSKMSQLFYQLHGRLSAQQVYKLTEALAIAEQQARDAAVYWADELRATSENDWGDQGDSQGLVGALERMRDSQMADAMEFAALKSHVLNQLEVEPKRLI